MKPGPKNPAPVEEAVDSMVDVVVAEAVVTEAVAASAVAVDVAVAEADTNPLTQHRFFSDSTSFVKHQLDLPV